MLKANRCGDYRDKLRYKLKRLSCRSLYYFFKKLGNSNKRQGHNKILSFLFSNHPAQEYVCSTKFNHFFGFNILIVLRKTHERQPVLGKPHEIVSAFPFILLDLKPNSRKKHPTQ